MGKISHTDKPLISIVIPVYQVAEQFLRQCVESCLNQTCSALEIVLVDDGSPDNSGAICDEFAHGDNRVKVIHQENGGVSWARNAGIAAASGAWVTFVDADDFLELTTCQEIMECVEKFPDLDLVAFSMVKNYEEREIPHASLYGGSRFFGAGEDMEQLREDVLTQQLDRNILRMTFCKAIRKEILHQNRVEFNPKLPLCEDVVFWFGAMQYVQRAYYLDRRLYHYRQVGNSATDKYRPEVVREHEELLGCLKAQIDASRAPERYMQGYYLEVFYSMQRIITQGYYHGDNPMPRSRRARECARVLGGSPYRLALKRLDASGLTRNHKIKYYLLRMRLYGAVSYLRLLYGGLTGRTTEKGSDGQEDV